MLTRLLALLAVLLLAPASAQVHANARALSLENASLGFFTPNRDFLKEIPDLSHCCIKEKSTERAESSNRREEYLRARYMDPAQGRFLGMDPWGGDLSYSPSLHKYAYANGNVPNAVDPSGLVTLGQLFTVVNVAGNGVTVATIGVNILTGNYVSAAGMIAEEVVYSKLGAIGRPVAHLSKRALALFYRIFGKKVNLRLGRGADGADLEHNLREVGVVKPPDTQAHHIIAGTSSRAQAARDVLTRNQIDINSPTNGVFLPNGVSIADMGTIHQGSHTYAYMDMVNDRIVAAESAGGKIAVLNELAEIKVELLAGLTQLNRHGVR